MEYQTTQYINFKQANKKINENIDESNKTKQEKLYNYSEEKFRKCFI